MNYHSHYERLIARARSRVLSGYVEVHHVLPKCLGGSNEAINLVQLTAEEHFVAHQLLHKIHPNVSGLAFSLVAMTGNPYGQRSNKLYGWMRKAHIKALSGWMKDRWNDPEYQEKHRASMARLHADPERMKKIGAAVSARHKGRVKSAQERANIAAQWKKPWRMPRKFSEQARANMAVAAKQRAAERRATGADKLIAAKMRATRMKNGSFAKTDEQRRKISEAQKGRIIPPEQRALISASMKAYRAGMKLH